MWKGNRKNHTQPPQHRHSFPSLAPQPEPKGVANVLGTKVEALPCIAHDNPTSGGERVETLGHVTTLAVQNDFRHLGLAKATMAHQLHHHLQHQGVSSCGLHVRTSNDAACRLYQEDGYEIAQMIPSYYQNGDDAYFMRNALPASTAPPSPSMLFGKKNWRTGPKGLRLSRNRAIETEDDTLTASQSSSGVSVSPELVTGTM